MSEMTETLEEFVTLIVRAMVLDYDSNGHDENHPFFPAGWATMEWVKDYTQEYTDRQIERLDEEYNFDDIPDGDDFVTKEKFDSITNHINERLDQIKWDSEPRLSYDEETAKSVHRLEARDFNISQRLDQIENALNHITRAGVHLNKVE
tara:strand:+ start:416 stop:862 length:447 start_codon:yes stop_codon:yes gene_type:complete